MSNIVPTKPRVVSGKRGFVIVASRFNATYVQGLVDHASDQLREQMPGAVITLYQVPGAFEIPIVVRELALQKKPTESLPWASLLKATLRTRRIWLVLSRMHFNASRSNLACR